MHVTITGFVCPGYGIASQSGGKSTTLVSNVYPDKREIVVDKTVWRQFPHFIQAGVKDLETMHPGTINIDISPYEFSIAVPDYEVTCEWIDGIKETFWLTSVGVICDDEEYDGYIYFPRISEQHHARNHMVEVITKKIDGIAYGAEHMLKFDHTKVTLVKKEESE